LSVAALAHRPDEGGTPPEREGREHGAHEELGDGELARVEVADGQVAHRPPAGGDGGASPGYLRGAAVRRPRRESAESAMSASISAISRGVREMRSTPRSVTR
jgi:hypothetical protein